MANAPSTGYISDNARTQAEGKTWLESVATYLAQSGNGGAAETTLTISGGVVTPTQVVHAIDGAATDTLNTIAVSNLPDGSVLILRPANPAHVITVTHNAGGTGQVTLLGGANLVLNTARFLVLKRRGTSWEQTIFSPGETPNLTGGRIAWGTKPAFRGCLAYNATAAPTILNATPTKITFDSESYDTDNIHSTSANTSDLVVPSGASKVRLSGNVFLNSPTPIGWFFIYKNGIAAPGLPSSITGGGGPVYNAFNISSAVISVSPGDVFTLWVQQNSGTALQLSTNAVWFAMEIVE